MKKIFFSLILISNFSINANANKKDFGKFVIALVTTSIINLLRLKKILSLA